MILRIAAQKDLLEKELNAMGKCTRHPDRETSYRCAKYNEYQCRECLRCKDPKIYCKHRPSCPIYMITERGLDPDE